MNKSIVATGSVIMALGVILGALGAHALKEHLGASQLASFETGVRYAMYHGIAFLILGLTADKLPPLRWSFRLLLSGVVLFSVSIFLLAMQGVWGVTLKFLGPVTPLGGVLMIAGWVAFTVSLLRKK